jgi:three-Cys-motif partner protein
MSASSTQFTFFRRMPETASAVAAPNTTIWDLSPHTRAKHEILRRYLQAWTPILSHGGFPDIIYIDGFAGPGRYSKGEGGSPIIVLRAALDQSIPPSTRLFFLFVERNLERAAVLQEIVDSIQRPGNFRVKVAQGGTFEAEAAELLAFYSSRQTASSAYLRLRGPLRVDRSTVLTISRGPQASEL